MLFIFTLTFFYNHFCSNAKVESVSRISHTLFYPLSITSDLLDYVQTKLHFTIKFRYTDNFILVIKHTAMLIMMQSEDLLYLTSIHAFYIYKNV